MHDLKKEATRQKWKNIIEDWRNSDLSVRDYCRTHHLSYQSFQSAKVILQRYFKTNPVISFVWPYYNSEEGDHFCVEIEFYGITYSPGNISEQDLHDYLCVIRRKMQCPP